MEPSRTSHIPSDTRTGMSASSGKILFFAICAYYLAVSTIFPPDGGERWYLINTVDLIFHEAGHTLTPPFIFGTFLHVLAGSLYQVVIPLVCAMYFFIKKEPLSTAVTLLWTAASLSYVSVYIGDAEAQVLPLLGEGGVFHDWHYLLGATHLLNHTDTIAKLVYTLAVGLSISTIVYTGVHFFTQGRGRAHSSEAPTHDIPDSTKIR